VFAFSLFRPRHFALLTWFFWAAFTPPSFASPPVLTGQGSGTQLIVDGKPFLILGGELANSSPSSLAQLQPARARFQKMHLPHVIDVWSLSIRGSPPTSNRRSSTEAS
jgi:hypothetical protein